MTYICENCGAKVEQETEVNITCPICKNGKLLSEKEWQEREEIYNALKDEEKEYQEPFTDPFENQEVQNMMINLKEEMFVYGNDGLWQLIEEIPDFKKRVQYRALFFKIGGVIPTKEGE